MRKMKDSGVEWLGNVPEGWELVQIGSLFSEHKNKNIGLQSDNLLSLSYGNIIRKDIATTDGLLPESFEGYNVIDDGDIVLRLTDLQNDQRSLRVGLSHERGIVTSAYVTLRKRDTSLNSQYFYYLIHSYDVRKGFYGMGAGVRQGLNFTGIRKIMLTLPSADEQSAISNFLGEKISKVDNLITNIKSQIEKLKAYKQSLITEVATKGLNPTAPTKDSGIEWMGDIPSSWKIPRGKNVFVLLDRPTQESDEVITCFRDGEVTLRKNRREEGFTFSEKEIGYQGIEAGDLVVHGMDGFAGSIGISDSRGKASPVLIVLDSNQNKRYLMYYLRSLAFRDIFLALSTGIRVRSCDLRWNKLSVLPILLPPIKEQDEIASYIDKKIKEIDKLISIKQRKIEKLIDYKKSIVYEYVTGKKEVQ